MQQPVYIYVLEHPNEPACVFTWPNACKKYIRDGYTLNGKLCLPPGGVLTLTRYKANPKAGQPVILSPLDIERFMAGA
jgi:hypothetical protein